jgi:ketosteroid isomerase-like protein
MDEAVGAVRQELEAAYQEAGQAFRQKDAASVLDRVTADFTQRMPDGQVLSLSEAEAAMIEWFATTDQVSRYSVQIDSLTVQGEEAVALVKESVTTTFADPTGKSHERAQTNTARVTWVQTERGWQIRHSEYLTAKMTVDGVPVRPLGVPTPA